MTARKPQFADLPNWPRLLTQAQAAAYCGVSPNFFAANVAIQATQIGGLKLYDRHALDRWIDALGHGTVDAHSIWLERLDADHPSTRSSR